jgi:hypothetical protein
VNLTRFEEMLASRGLTPENIAACKKFNLTAVNKALSDKLPRGSKEKGVAEFRADAILAGVMEKEPAIYFLERNRS